MLRPLYIQVSYDIPSYACTHTFFSRLVKRYEPINPQTLPNYFSYKKMWLLGTGSINEWLAVEYDDFVALGYLIMCHALVLVPTIKVIGGARICCGAILFYIMNTYYSHLLIKCSLASSWAERIDGTTKLRIMGRRRAQIGVTFQTQKKQEMKVSC